MSAIVEHQIVNELYKTLQWLLGNELDFVIKLFQKWRKL
jgi:hypothetical protein